MKKLSIIVPCYNVENYLERCVDSLVNQTLNQFDYEIILVDDASTDGTWRLISELAERYPKLIIAVRYVNNGRQGKARNVGIDYARGEYLGFVDSDDWVEKDMFETLLKEAYAYKQDVVMCRSIRDTGEGPLYLDNKDEELIVNRTVVDDESKLSDFLLSACMGYSVWDKIVKKSLLVDNNIRFPEGLAYEDIYYGSLLHLYAKRVSIIDKTFYHYFVNPGSTVLLKSAGYHRDIMTVNKMTWQAFKDRGFWNKLHDELEINLLFTWYLGTMKVICLRFAEPPYDMFLELKKDILECMPGAYNNRYIKMTMKEFYQLLIELLTCEVSKEVLLGVSENFRRI